MPVVSEFSMAAATLAGARWEVEGDTIVIHLRANGKAELEEHLHCAVQAVENQFGFRPAFRVEAGNATDGEQLYAQTEKLRQSLLQQVEQAAPRPKAKEEKKDASELIYGRPVKGEPVPLRDLSLDMSTVTVEGQVFAVNHRELKKRNAWVVSFDITDFTSSVRINQFMEQANAKPILDRVKNGMWLKIQGKMTVDRYEHENVLQPTGIMVGQKRLRQDTAEEKRVELHLHTKMSAMDALTDPGAVVAQAAGGATGPLPSQTMACCSRSPTP